MTDFNGFDGNRPVSLVGNGDSGSNVDSAPLRPGSLKERKIADALAKLLDTIDLDANWVAFCFRQKGTALQSRMADLCFAFVRHWAIRYDTGDVRQGQVLYPICETAYRMHMTTERDARSDAWEASRILG